MGASGSVLEHVEALSEEQQLSYVLDLTGENRRTQVQVLQLLLVQLTGRKPVRRVFSDKSPPSSPKSPKIDQQLLDAINTERMIVTLVEKLGVLSVLKVVIEECLVNEVLLFDALEGAAESNSVGENIKTLFDVLMSSLDIIKNLTRCRAVQAYLASPEAGVTSTLQRIVLAYLACRERKSFAVLVGYLGSRRRRTASQRL